MQTVAVSRTIDAPTDAVVDAMHDLEPFIAAAGFDAVDVDGDTVRVENAVGVATIRLTLGMLDDPAAELAYEQREGIFERMWTGYTVESVDRGTAVTATTEFALDVPLVGGVLDATVIGRQRRKELEAQFDWLETTVAN